MNLIHLCFLILLGLIQSFGSSGTAYAKAEASLIVQSADAANHEYTAANPFAENLAVAFLIAESVDEEEEEESQTEPTSDCTFFARNNSRSFTAGATANWESRQPVSFPTATPLYILFQVFRN